MILLLIAQNAVKLNAKDKILRYWFIFSIIFYSANHELHYKLLIKCVVQGGIQSIIMSSNYMSYQASMLEEIALHAEIRRLMFHVKYPPILH